MIQTLMPYSPETHIKRSPMRHPRGRAAVLRNAFIYLGLPYAVNSDERRSVRLNALLRFYAANPQPAALFERAKQMGVTDATARDYARTVMARAGPRASARVSSRPDASGMFVQASRL